MADRLTLGRLAGAPVAVDWTVGVAVAVVAVVLAAGHFPSQHPELPGWAHAAAGAVAGLLYVASLAAHELAHAIVARRHGITVERLSLWAFGGLGPLGSAPPGPRADLRISCAGPIVSATIAAALWALSTVTAAVGAPGIVVAVLAWGAAMNLLLAVFNLAPAMPLDGGRLLRSMLWQRTGDRRRASEVAVRAGQVFGFATVALGLLAFVFLPGLGGLWIAVIGAVVMTAASSEERRERAGGAFERLPVSDLMTQRPLSVRADVTVDELLEEYVLRTGHSAYPVVSDDDRPIGLVTLTRLREVPPERRATTPVADVACPLDRLPVARPTDPAERLLPGMAGCPEGRALVVDDGRLVGMVSATDVMRHLPPGAAEGPRQPAERRLRAGAPRTRAA